MQCNIAMVLFLCSISEEIILRSNITANLFSEKGQFVSRLPILSIIFMLQALMQNILTKWHGPMVHGHKLIMFFCDGDGGNNIMGLLAIERQQSCRLQKLLPHELKVAWRMRPGKKALARNQIQKSKKIVSDELYGDPKLNWIGKSTAGCKISTFGPVLDEPLKQRNIR